MRIGFIGAGKVGCSLAKYLLVCGFNVCGFYSLSSVSAKQASQFTNSHAFETLEALVQECDCIFITVPDSQIVSVWSELMTLKLNNKLVGHCSGLLSSQVFSHKQVSYPFGFSLHPLYAIQDRFNSYISLHHAYFTLEANEGMIEQLLTLFKPLKNPIATIRTEKKALYHAACVLLSNHVIALAELGSQLFMHCGLDDQFAKQAWQPLFLDNAQALCHLGAKQALTGPVERGDVATIQQHLAALPDEIKPIYQYLSKVLINLSQQKHPDKDYQRLQLELSF